MSEINQVVTAVATAICCCVIFGFIVKYMYDELRLVKDDLAKSKKDIEESLEEMDEKKIDRDMCSLQHRQILQDLEDGRAKFKDLLNQNSALTGDVGRLTTQLALILQRLELSLPKIERAAAGLLPADGGGYGGR